MFASHSKVARANSLRGWWRRRRPESRKQNRIKVNWNRRFMQFKTFVRHFKAQFSEETDRRKDIQTDTQKERERKKKGIHSQKKRFARLTTFTFDGDDVRCVPCPGRQLTYFCSWLRQTVPQIAISQCRAQRPPQLAACHTSCNKPSRSSRVCSNLA